MKITMKARTQELVKRLESAGPKMDDAVRTEVSHSAYEIQAKAKQRAPVRTGRLRDSISVRFENGGRTALIGTDVFYARFQKRKFMQPAARSVRPKFVLRLTEHLKKAGL